MRRVPGRRNYPTCCGPTEPRKNSNGRNPIQAYIWHLSAIPTEVGVTSIRREAFHDKSNNQQLRVNLDCLDEVRDRASDRIAEYQKKMTEYYNRRVRLRRLHVGDLVLRKVTTATRNSTQGKLGPTWEGPYRVTHYSRQGSYHLETLDGKALPRPWNIEHLKKYHQKV
ncbi:uncharacterized protein LOC142616384 [Castanea sativa]|uniref:uncharacterized protein LOC142616384 n=1 Tax=Castanea sativa TaxID=21020 RepID=UPI003F653A60